MRSSAALLMVLLLAATGRAADYTIARPGYRFEFPRDYYNHPAYEMEWWYTTGNVRDAAGHRFGFELTFFRQAVSREASASPWYVHDLYMAHFALSDVTGGHYYHTERLNRSGPGIAGIDASRELIWNGNWQLHMNPETQQLRAVAEDYAIDLRLRAAKAPDIQGQNGVSQKAAGAGHASHYYSLTRLITSGSVEVQGRTYQVEGASWMDHEFFTGGLAPGEAGWDWVGLQLDNNTELMLYRMRRKDGTLDPFSSGSYVDAAGHATFLSSRDFSMTPAGEDWTSSRTHAQYPLRWHVRIPSLHAEFDITTPLQDQELISRVGPSYWEGAVDVSGGVRGVGYLEMTGYAAGSAQKLP